MMKRKKYRNNPSDWPKRKVAWGFVENYAMEAGYVRVDQSAIISGDGDNYFMFALGLLTLEQYSSEDRAEILRQARKKLGQIPAPHLHDLSLMDIDRLISDHYETVYVPIAYVVLEFSYFNISDYDAAWTMFDTGHEAIERVLDKFEPEDPITRRGRLLEHADFVPPGTKKKLRKKTADERLLSTIFNEDPDALVEDEPNFYLHLRANHLRSVDEEDEYVKIDSGTDAFVTYRMAAIVVPNDITLEFVRTTTRYVARLLKMSIEDVVTNRLVDVPYEHDASSEITFPAMVFREEGSGKWLPTVEKIPQFLFEFKEERGRQRIVDLDDDDDNDFDDEDDEAGRWLKKRR